ncbi:MAG: hypothetical protein IID37_10860 [Planctomycetes bacterium]|nr:hypothetical protein [Planctomycetota bacterium]
MPSLQIRSYYSRCGEVKGEQSGCGSLQLPGDSGFDSPGGRSCQGSARTIDCGPRSLIRGI